MTKEKPRSLTDDGNQAELADMNREQLLDTVFKQGTRLERRQRMPTGQREDMERGQALPARRQRMILRRMN